MILAPVRLNNETYFNRFFCVRSTIFFNFAFAKVSSTSAMTFSEAYSYCNRLSHFVFFAGAIFVIFVVSTSQNKLSVVDTDSESCRRLNDS